MKSMQRRRLLPKVSANTLAALVVGTYVIQEQERCAFIARVHYDASLLAYVKLMNDPTASEEDKACLRGAMVAAKEIYADLNPLMPTRSTQDVSDFWQAA